MPEFYDCTQLSQFLQSEANERTRFPTRFILVRGLEIWWDVVNRLMVESDEIIALSSLCEESDVFPFLDDLFPLLDQYKGIGKKVLVLPLAECIRLGFDSGEILRKLAAREDVGYGRIYIPLFEIEEEFKQTMIGSSRFQDMEMPDAWSVIGKGNVKLQVVPFDLKGWPGKSVKGIKAYLKKWEKSGEANLCLVTRNAPNLRERFGNFHVRVYKDGFDVISAATQGITVIKKEWGQEKQWQWLAKEIKWQEKFDELAARLFNVNSYDALQLFSQWSAYNDDKKWLLWLWSKTQIYQDNYLKRVMSASINFRQFTEDVSNSSFNKEMDFEMLKERKCLLEYMKVSEMPPSYWKYIEELSDPLEKLKYLTGITDREKEEIVLAVKSLLEENKETKIWWPYLEISFPELANYLVPVDYEDELINRYYHAYKYSRVMDRPTKELLELAGQASEQKKQLMFQTRNSLLEQFHDHILWVDGMGLEWLGLIKELFAQEGIKMKVMIARASMPTTTKFNKGWVEEKDVERGIDDIAHKHNYRFPGSFIEQISVLKNVAKKAAALLNTYKSIIITSDHGLTRFAFHEGKVEPPEGAKVHKWGRYAELGNNVIHEDFYNPDWLTENNKIILKGHKIFSGSSRNKGEVHGGATLEESLVPIIKIYKEAGVTVSKPNFKLSEQRIKLNTKGEGYLIITAQVNKLSLRVSDKVFYGVPTKGANKWNIFIKGLGPGEYKGKLEYEDGYLGEVEFKLVKGLVQDDLGL